MKAFESIFVKASQSIVKRLVFGMCSRYERHSTTGHYVNVVARHIKMLDVRIYFKSKRELKLNIPATEKKLAVVTTDEIFFVVLWKDNQRT